MRKSTPLAKLALTVVAMLFSLYMASAQTCSAGYTSSVNIPAKTVTFTNTSTGTGLNYFWNFGDGNYSSLASPTHVYMNNGTYFVSLSISSGIDSCYDAITDTIQVGSPCLAGFYYSISPANVHTYNFYSTSTGTNLMYLWDFGDGTYSTLTNPSHTYTTNGTKTVHLYINNLDSSCFDSKTVSIIVTNTCTALADFMFAGDSSDYRKLYFNNTSIVNNPTFYWWFGDGSSSAATSPNHTYSAPGTYMVCLWAFDSLNASCQDSTCKLVNISNPCSAAFSFSADTPNNNLTKLYFYSNTTAPGLTYNWNFGDGYSSSLKNPLHQYGAPGTYNVCLTVTNPADSFCYDHLCIPITVGGSLCDATFYAYADSTTGLVYFGPMAFDTLNTLYFWSFGDGATSSNPYPAHHYTTSGYYIVCLTTASIDSSCWATYCDTIYVPQPAEPVCDAHFTPSPFGNREVWFNNTSPYYPGSSYYWTFGDGTSSYWHSPTHQYAHDGPYIVCLTVSSFSLDSCWATFCDTVFIGSGSSCNANFHDSSFSNGRFSFINTSTSGPGPLYFWDFGDGHSSNAYTPSHQYSQNGIYTVCLTLGSMYDSTCWDIYCDTVLVNDMNNDTLCHAAFSYGTDSLNGITYFYNMSSSGSGFPTYYWNFGDGTSSGLANPTHHYASPGWYTVCLTVSTWDNSCWDSYCDTIYVSGSGDPCAGVVADFTYSGDAINPLSIHFSNLSSGSGLSYIWNFGGAGYSTSANPTATFPASGIYIVSLFVYNPVTGCSDTIEKFVNVGGSSCQAYFTSYDQGNGTVWFYDLSSGSGLSYFWDFGDGTTSSLQNPSHTYSTDGTYHVSLTIYNANCMDSMSQIIYVNTSGCDARFYAYRDTLTFDNIVGFYPYNNSSNVTYSWSFGDGTTSSLPHPTHVYSLSGYYIVCLTVTADSCSDTHCDTIVVYAPTGLVDGPQVNLSNAYPVPFTNELNLDIVSPGTTRSKVIIMDMTGKTILEKDVTLQKDQNTVSFDTHELSKGVYFVDLVTEYGHTVKKICK